MFQREKKMCKGSKIFPKVAKNVPIRFLTKISRGHNVDQNYFAFIKMECSS